MKKLRSSYFEVANKSGVGMREIDVFETLMSNWHLNCHGSHGIWRSTHESLHLNEREIQCEQNVHGVNQKYFVIVEPILYWLDVIFASFHFTILSYFLFILS